MKLILGDCEEKIKELKENSVDAGITDPPYGWSFMGKKWDYDVPSVDTWKECFRVLKPGGHILVACGTRTQHRMCVNIEDAGFEIRDMILYLYGSGFPKSLNIEKQLTKMLDNGNMVEYEDRDDRQIPSQQEAKYELRLMQEANISQTVNPKTEQGEVLQPSLQKQIISTPIQQLSNNEGQGQPCVEGRYNLQASQRELQRCKICALSKRISKDGKERWICYGTPFSYGTTHWQNTPKDRSCPSYRPQSKQQLNSQSNAIPHKSSPQKIRRTINTHKGFGTALKPAVECWSLCRKPLEKGLTVAENVLKWGTGGINIDGCRVEHNEPEKITNRKQRSAGWNPDTCGFDSTKNNTASANPQGRFPANLIHDGSDEVADLFPDTKQGKASGYNFEKGNQDNPSRNVTNIKSGVHFADSGSAARFFYCAKASKKERNMGCEGLEEKFAPKGNNEGRDMDNPKNHLGGMQSSVMKNHHPTVKPVALMRYLCRLITPNGGTILDPYMGSGSTGIAAKQEGFSFIGIEKEPEYLEIAKKRIEVTQERLF